MMTAAFSHTDKTLLLQHGTTALLQLAQRRGGQLHKLLSGTSIFEQDLTNPHGRCQHKDWLTLISRCQQLKSPELPFLLADSMLNNQCCALSQSVSVAKNLAQSMQQLLYFRHQLFPCLYPQVQQLEQTVMLLIKPGLALGSQLHFVVNLAISFIIKLIKQQLGSTAELKVLLQQESPTHLQHFATHWQCNISFGQHFDAICIPMSLWQQTFAEHQPAQFRLLRLACYQLNARLPAQRGLLEILQRHIAKTLPTQLSLEQAAAALKLSSSSLKRLLQQHHTNFAALADEVRRDKARLLLLQGNVSNRQLAQQLGYSDEHNFRRAFKRWTGMLPSSVKAFINQPF